MTKAIAASASSESQSMKRIRATLETLATFTICALIIHLPI